MTVSPPVPPLFRLFNGPNGSLGAQLTTAVIAGRLREHPPEVRYHLPQIEALGQRLPAPPTEFYPVPKSRVTDAQTIQVVGSSTAGDVCLVLLQQGGRLWVGIGSDHADRAVQRHEIARSKQLCDKPVGSSWWAYEDVAGHWERLSVAAYAGAPGKPLQQVQLERLSAAARLESLVHQYAGSHTLAEGTILFCTLATRPAPIGHGAFRCVLEDAAWDRRLEHEYKVEVLTESLDRGGDTTH